MLEPIPYSPPPQPYHIDNNHGNFGPQGQDASSSIVSIDGTDDNIAISSTDRNPTAWFVNGTQSASIGVNDDGTIKVDNKSGTGITVVDQKDLGSDGHAYNVTMDGKTFNLWVSQDRHSIAVRPDGDTKKTGDFEVRRDDFGDKSTVSSNLFSPDSPQADDIGNINAWSGTSPHHNEPRLEMHSYMRREVIRAPIPK